MGDPEATVKINGIAATVGNGTFSASVPLHEGLNTITAVASNSGGTISTASIQTSLDTTPPKLAITSPGDGAATTEGQVTVTGTVNDIVVGTVNDEQARSRSTASMRRSRTAASSCRTCRSEPGREHHSGAGDGSNPGNSATALLTVRREALTEAALRLVSGDNQAGANRHAAAREAPRAGAWIARGPARRT